MCTYTGFHCNTTSHICAWCLYTTSVIVTNYFPDNFQFLQCVVKVPNEYSQISWIMGLYMPVQIIEFRGFAWMFGKQYVTTTFNMSYTYTMACSMLLILMQLGLVSTKTKFSLQYFTYNQCNNWDALCMNCLKPSTWKQ